MKTLALFFSLLLSQTPEPVSEAGAEEKLRAKLPYDCLGGVCLNAQASVIQEKVVQVVGHNFRRYTKTCNGRVVLIRLTASWTHVGSSSYAVPGANTLWSTLENDVGALGPSDVYIRLDSGLGTMGWEPSKASGWWTSPKVQGNRSVDYRDNLASDYTALDFISEHPRKDELCAYQKVQGL